jgi:anaerobic magnesium-protoporphyrin IX monomethyl ester cyclase
MYDCILINPRSIYYSLEQQSAPYLYAGILSIGSLLHSKGLKTAICDMVVENDPIQALRERIGGKDRAVLVGLSVMTSQVPHAIEISRFIKNEYPNASIIWGGIHSSLFPEDILKEGLADYVCIGEGEYTTLDLLTALRDKRDVRAMRAVQGLCFLDKNAVVSTEKRPCHSLDELPYFNYELFDYPRYKNRTVFRGDETAHVKFGTILTSFGCPYRCTFCINSNKKLYFGKYRSKSTKRIVDEIEYLITTNGIDYLDFVDENFFVKRQNIEAFIEELSRRKLSFRWNANIRADAFRPPRNIVDPELLGKLRELGCYKLAIGAESGSQKILDKLKKDIKVEDILLSAEIISKSGIGATYSFMMGIPGETMGDIESTLNIIQKLKSFGCCVSIVGPQVFRPYPGGDLYEECITKYGYNYPKRVVDWGNSVDMLTGFESIDKMPWIENPKIIKRIQFYVDLFNLNTEAIVSGQLKKAALKFAKFLATIRVRFKFWIFPAEMSLILAIKNTRRKKQ